MRQPLRVLLHLPAAAGPAAQPLPQGRRLPAVVPLRELHDAHPLHRGRPRAGRDRGPLARSTCRSTPPTPTCGPTCCATAAAACRLRWLRAAARPRRRGASARSSCAPGSTTAPSSRTRSAACSTSTPSWPPLAVVPLGVSAHNREPRMRPHTRGEAERRASTWSRPGRRSFLARARPAAGLRRRRVPPAGRPAVPAARRTTRASPMHEDGIGMAATFEAELPRRGRRRPASRRPSPASSPGSTAPPAEGYRRRPVRLRDRLADRLRGWPRRSPAPEPGSVTLRARRGAPVGVLTGELRRPGARPAAGRPRSRRRAGRGGRQPLLRRQHRRHRAAGGGGPGPGAGRPSRAGHRYLLPDVCLSDGRFLDGTTPADLPRAVEVVPTDGVSLRRRPGA